MIFSSLSTKVFQAKRQRNKRTMITSTAMRAMMISSIECVDDWMNLQINIFTEEKS